MKVNTTTKVVIGLLAETGMLEAGRIVYMDNYLYPEIFEELYLLNTYVCGTLRKNHIAEIIELLEQRFGRM